MSMHAHRSGLLLILFIAVMAEDNVVLGAVQPNAHATCWLESSIQAIAVRILHQQSPEDKKTNTITIYGSCLVNSA